MNDIPPVPPSANWRTALADLLGTRLALIQYEFKHAAQAGIRRAALFAAAALCVIFAWIILMAAVIGGVSAGTGLAWYWVALIAGGVHLAVAAILVILAKRPTGAAFEITIAEFKKDRVWLESLQSHPKSGN